MKPIVILDVGGVLATNLKPTLWQELSLHSSLSSEELYAAYKKDISKSLWVNKVSEEQFWAWLEQFEIGITVDQQKALIEQALQPLPALSMLSQWSQYAQLHVMSNHLHQWLDPFLAPYAHFFTDIHISSRYEMKKPELEWFQTIHNRLPANRTIWFVDDSRQNLLAAEQVGWRGIWADEQSQWIIELTKAIQQ